MRTSKPEIIIVHETAMQSYLVDSSTFVLFAALIGLGIFLDSTAMQWVGAIIGFLTIAAKTNRHRRMTPDEARKRISEIEAAP